VADSRSYRVVAAFSGDGNRTTKHFTVKAKLPWQVRWTYSCAARADAGHFMLLRADMAANQSTLSTSVDEYAARGHGSAWLKPAGHRHYLLVVSACSWHIKVIQAV
jgi:hypothetical protein